MTAQTPICHGCEIHPEHIRRAAEALPQEAELCRLAEYFKLFGDPTRLRILFALSSSELCVCDLSDLLGVTKSAVSHQLKALRRDNFVAYRRAGKNVFYRLSDEHVGTILHTAFVHINEPLA